MKDPDDNLFVKFADDITDSGSVKKNHDTHQPKQAILKNGHRQTQCH